MSVPRFALACVVAMFAVASFAQQPDIVRAIAAENASLSAQLTDDTKALERESVELADLRKAKRDLDERMHRVELRAAVYSLGQEFEQTLTETAVVAWRPQCARRSQGDVQTVVFDAPTLQYWAAKEGNGAVQMVGPIFRPEKYAIVVAEGSALRKPINEALLEIYDDGTYEKINAKWFSQASRWCQHHRAIRSAIP